MDFLAYLMKNETWAGGLVWKRGKMTELESFHIYIYIYVYNNLSIVGIQYYATFRWTL